MSKFLLSLAALAVMVIPVAATEYKLPKKESIFSVKFPDSWKVTQEGDSVEAFSGDEAVAIWMQTDDASTIDDSMKANIEYLNEQGVKLDQKTRKDTEGEHNGMPMSTVSWKGTDAESDCSVSLIFLHPTEDTAITMLYWATEEEVKKNAKDIDSVIESMKPLGAAAKKKAKSKEKAKTDDSEE